MALRIETSEQNGEYVINATGEVDLYTSPSLRRAILDAPAKTARNICVDLGKVEYMDSSGVATLVEGYKRALKTKSEFAIVSPSPSVMKVLQLSRLDSVFQVKY